MVEAAKEINELTPNGEHNKYDVFRATGLFKLDSIARFVDHTGLQEEQNSEREDSDADEEAHDDIKTVEKDVGESRGAEADEEEKKILAKFSNRKFKGLQREKNPLDLLKELKAKKNRGGRKERFEVVFVYTKHPGKNLGAQRVRFGCSDPLVRDSQVQLDSRTKEKMY